MVAIRPPTSTRAVGPNTMPFGLTSITVPLALSRPKMADGSLPSTRFSVTLLTVGWTKLTVSPLAMLKLVQLMMALSEPWRMSSVCGTLLTMLTVPATTWAPLGLAHAVLADSSAPASSASGRYATWWLDSETEPARQRSARRTRRGQRTNNRSRIERAWRAVFGVGCCIMALGFGQSGWRSGVRWFGGAGRGAVRPWGVRFNRSELSGERQEHPRLLVALRAHRGADRFGHFERGKQARLQVRAHAAAE